MSAETNQSVPAVPANGQAKALTLPTVSMGTRGIAVCNIRDLVELASMVINAGWAPQSLVQEKVQGQWQAKPAKQAMASVCMAIQTGLELGITPTQALSGIAVVNQRPAVWGDLGVALIQGSGLLESWEEWWEVDGEQVKRPPTYANRQDYPDSLTAVCRLRRKGIMADFFGSFSVGQARSAQLWTKKGPWQEYALRMLRWRAVSWACRDGFADVLKGLMFREEAMDLPDTPRVVTPSVSELLPIEEPRVQSGSGDADVEAEAPESAPRAVKQRELIDEIAPEPVDEPGMRG